VLHLPFTGLVTWSLPAGVALWAFALLRPASPGPGRGEPVSGGRLGAVAGSLVLAAAAIALLHTARLGPPITYESDSPDHVATIRRMLATGDAFPTDVFFRDAGPAGADPRKGLWHPEVALVCRLAAVDPLVAWRTLGCLLAALHVLNAAALGLLIAGPAGAAVGAWALLLTYGGSLPWGPLREAVFSTKLADQLALATIVAVLVDLEVRRPATRLAAAALALGTVVVHVFPAIQFALVFGTLGLGFLLRDRGVGAPLRRLTVTAVTIGVACLPYLLWRAHAAYAPANAIHTEPQGLLILWDGVRVVAAQVLWEWMGLLWVLFPLCWIPLWRRGRHQPAVLYVLTSSLAAAVILFVPPVVELLRPRLGYLLMRVIWLVPLAGLLAWLLPALARGLARGPARSRAWAAAGLAGVLLLAAPTLRDDLHVLLAPSWVAEEDWSENPLRWREDLGWLERHGSPGDVVLSDPATSYAIPMLAGLHVVTVVDQHSSPNDARALERLLDARDALDPYATWDRVRQVVRRWGVSLIVLNDRFQRPPPLAYWTPRHPWFREARARFDAAPAAFPRLYDHGDFVVYRLHREALDTLSAPPRPREFVTPGDPARLAAARSMGPGLPELVGFALDRSSARRGDTLQAVAQWHAPSRLAAGSYVVALRFDRPLPGGWRFPAFMAKPARKVLEAWRGERFRFRVDHLPAGGEYGVDQWRPDEVVRDSFPVPVPAWVAPGDYQVRVRMVHQPIYPIYRLSDFFSDEDVYSGLPVATLALEVPPPGDAPAVEAGGRSR
jgi:hypothetical protein